MPDNQRLVYTKIAKAAELGKKRLRTKLSTLTKIIRIYPRYQRENIHPW
jgi:hypothetical protein